MTALAADPKVRRINLRASVTEENLLRLAARAAHTSLSQFVLGSAIEQAQKMLAERRSYELSEAEFKQFEAMLDREYSSEKLARLFAADSIFGKSFELAD